MADCFRRRLAADDHVDCPGLSDLSQYIAQRLSFDQLHGVIQRAVHLTEVVYGDDIGMFEAGGQRRLSSKARHRVRPHDAEQRRQHLERHHAVE